MMSLPAKVILCTPLLLADFSAAEITGCMYHGYQRTATDFTDTTVECYVVDMYLVAGSSSDTLLQVNDLNFSNSLGDVLYYQAPSGPEWRPTFYPDTPYDTRAAMYLDSFVSTGGRTHDGVPSLDEEGNLLQMSANGTQLDADFGPPTIDVPNENGGWFNAEPDVPIGLAFDSPIVPINSLTIFIGRFSVRDVEAFDLSGLVSVTWNEGPGTDHRQGSFRIMEMPAPGGLAVGLLAGLATRRRRAE
ncbi:MAG: hypothetical protein MK085_01985 [Phycisphaerales bacterium]|nr:hypothetical protein [Phycisphaerales bacterium]